MDVITNSYSTPAENLAFEDFFFNSFEKDTLRLWINPPSVIVGKHQCALAEINYPYCESEHLPVLRRISGGGTVFHDFGNINFSFFRNLDQDHKIDYGSNLEIIKAALTELGYSVEINERYDIYHEEFKVSGNAQHIKRRKALHHGTILYDADDSALRESISKPIASFDTKAVQSVRSKIKNLRAVIDLGTTNEFVERLVNAIEKQGHVLGGIEVSQDQLTSLIIEKYGNADWNYGYGPKYDFKISENRWDIALSVARGGEIRHSEVNLKGMRQAEVESILVGKKHHPSSLISYISNLKMYSEEETQNLIKALF